MVETLEFYDAECRKNFKVHYISSFSIELRLQDSLEYYRGVQIASIVEKDSTASEPYVSPEVDATFVSRSEVCCFGSVVECSSGSVGYMAEAVPLCSGLGVQSVDVVISVALGKRLNLVLKLLPAHSR